MSVEEILSWYSRGYCPYASGNDVRWERREMRGMIPLNEESVAHALRLLRAIRPQFTLQYDHAIGMVLEHLSDERVKPGTWVRGGVITLYRTLQRHGFLKTVEATRDGKLVGALLAIDLPGIVMIESMFSLASNSSKQCACQAVLDYHERGYAFIDVENPHHPRHPLTRLGEKVVSIAEYQRLLRESVHEFSKRCPAGRSEQLRLCISSFAQAGDTRGP
jgi:leucyl/phenylalanyl-tRNA--protein transferase